ncbi:Variant-specific surface protein [Giardia duodenalis]|uniref:Variant-specific surface protein n=1 Tax=Giardia intestinalis TaxID=5741 RepID=V6TRB2_GIAIN|nr:Variant-specific surface protein [Giardia intestinalis]
MSGKFLLIGIILQLAQAVWVAGGDCESGKFPVANLDGNGNTCVPCNDSNKGGIGHCMECTVLPPKARSSAVFIKCTKCSTNALSPLGDACLADCPYGSYETTTTPDNTRVCIPCHPSCARCNNNAGAAFCTACYPGFVLSHPNGPFGTCIPECTEEFSANCETGYCTADIVGSKYCSKCKSGFAPMNGVCVLAETTRVASDGCPSKEDGVCASCANTYLLQSGGCYNTQTFPAHLICTKTDNNGKCSQCANTLSPSNGVCPACPAGCSKCSGSSGSQTCSDCLAGYYLSGTKCVKCTENSTNGGNTITGVKDCVSCTAPTGSGTVTCYVTRTPTVDPADPSVNKGGLSNGVIASISVIAVLVVGALISFICWWFLCKTKRAGVSSNTTTLIRSKSA